MIYVLKALPIGYKVGYTGGPISTRLDSIQHYCPVEVNLWFCFDGDRLAERSIHKHLEAYALRGEWYRPTAGDALELLRVDPAYRASVANDQAAYRLIGRRRRPKVGKHDLCVHATIQQKAAWKQAAKSVGVDLAAWIVEVLDRAAGGA